SRCSHAWLGIGTARQRTGRDRVDALEHASLPCHRSRDTPTVLSGAPRRSTWDYGTVRGRTDGAHGSTNAHRHNWRTLVRARVASAQRRTSVTTIFGQSG